LLEGEIASTAAHMERLARLYRRYGENAAALDGRDQEEMLMESLHDVAAETHRCHWDGARPDYGTMVQLLD
jgi:hypothetical protein